MKTIRAWIMFSMLFAAACGQRSETPDAPAKGAPPEPVSVVASDAVTDLTAAPTGVDFWTHPNVAFNGLIVIASADGLTSYTIESGEEVSRAPGVALTDIAISYIGFGPLAAGIATAFDEGEGAFRFYGIDNVSRLFLPLAGGPVIRGAVRGFCMGRGATSPDPTLFVVQQGELTIYNLAPAMDGDEASVNIAGKTTVTIPDAVTKCAVGSDGVVYVTGAGGDIFRLDGDNAFAAPFASAFTDAPADMEFLGASAGDPAQTGAGQIAVLDAASGMVEFFDAVDGHALGAVRISETDEIDAVNKATTMGASAANLGGLYRDGVLALGVNGGGEGDGEDGTPALRLVPANGVANALALTPLPPENPRGEEPLQENETDLIINPIAPVRND